MSGEELDPHGECQEEITKLKNEISDGKLCFAAAALCLIGLVGKENAEFLIRRTKDGMKRATS